MHIHIHYVHTHMYVNTQDVCRRVEGCETDPEAEYALSIVSIAGASLSLMGLIMTVFTMLYFKLANTHNFQMQSSDVCLNIGHLGREMPQSFMFSSALPCWLCS